jgi:hypothetical protein
MPRPERWTLRECWESGGDLHLRLEADDGGERHIVVSLTSNDVDDLYDALVGVELGAEAEAGAGLGPGHQPVDLRQSVLTVDKAGRPSIPSEPPSQ